MVHGDHARTLPGTTIDPIDPNVVPEVGLNGEAVFHNLPQPRSNAPMGTRRAIKGMHVPFMAVTMGGRGGCR